MRFASIHARIGRRLALLRAAVFSALCLQLAAAQAAPLVSPEQLAARLAQTPAPRVLDIRAGKDDAGRSVYEVGHIAGSVPAPYPQWRGPKDNPGQLPPADKLAALLQSLGIEADTPVVIVYEGADATDFGAAARVYWTLKVAGVRDLAILNGGLAAWRAARLPLQAGAAPAVARSSIVPALDATLIATRDEVEQARQSGALLLDARPAAFFRGETRHAAAKIPGTIAGARSLDNAVWFRPGTAALRDADELRQLAAQHGLKADAPTVSFCNTGHWAATNWFVLSELLGQREVSLYPESMVEWSRAGGAMDNVPGRLRQFWLQLREAAGAL